MFRTIRLALLSLGLGGLIAGAALAACSTGATTPPVPPITGIEIRADALIGGLGCGTQPGQVYRYVAILLDTTNSAAPNGIVLSAQSYDCFADAIFSNLNATANGGYTFRMLVYLYDLPTYTADQASIKAGLAKIATWDGAPPPNFVNPFSTIAASWTTSCTATQTANIEALAVCDPLVSGAPQPAPDGGTDAMAPEAAPPDAAEAGPDGPDAADSTPGADGSGDTGPG